MKFYTIFKLRRSGLTHKITKDKFVNIESNEEYKAILVSSRVLMDNRQFYIKEFDNNYYFNFKSEYRFFKFIESYVRTRIFDMKALKKDMEAIINTIDTEKLPGYKRLLTEEYWKISDEQFPGIIEEVLEDVKKGKLKLIEITKLFAYYSYFIKRGLVEKDIKEVKQIFMNGMDIAYKTSEFCDNVEEELSRIGIDNTSSQEMEEILNYFTVLNSKLEEKMYREKADDIFKCIPIKMELFYDRFDNECMEFPIFKYYDAYRMFQRITCASNEDIVRIKEILIDRAKKNSDKLKEEYNFMKQLKKALEDYCRGKETNIKIVMLKEFYRDLGIVIDLYKPTFFGNNKEESNN